MTSKMSLMTAAVLLSATLATGLPAVGVQTAAARAADQTVPGTDALDQIEAARFGDLDGEQLPEAPRWGDLSGEQLPEAPRWGDLSGEQVPEAPRWGDLSGEQLPEAPRAAQDL